jgi:MarR family transcriptional regulator, temperature-dependent positive regulator of motility
MMSGAADKTNADRASAKQAAGKLAAAAKPEGFLLTQSTSHLLHRAQQMAADAFARAYPGDDLTFRQFAVLAAVSETPGVSQSDLVRATGIDRSTLADMIARMEKKNLLSREASKSDGRAKSVKLTAKGQRKLTDAAPVAMQADEAILGALPKPKQRGFFELLEALQAAAEAAALIAASENGLEKRAKKGAKKAAKKRAKR